MTKIYRRLENIEFVEDFCDAVSRKNLSKSLSAERPYTYWTTEFCDEEIGFNLSTVSDFGVLAADTRRIAEGLNLPMVVVAPFFSGWSVDFLPLDTVNVRTSERFVPFEISEKDFGTTKILCIAPKEAQTAVFAGMTKGDRGLFEDVALGFGGYVALKLAGVRPAIMHLNNSDTFFAALARLDEIVANGMDFYEAVVYTRKHTLFASHASGLLGEPEYTLSQFETFVFPNLKSNYLKHWLRSNFENGKIKLSKLMIELSGLRTGDSELFARTANYHDFAGNKVKIKPIADGIDLGKWVFPELWDFYAEKQILNRFGYQSVGFDSEIEKIDADIVRKLKSFGRANLNKILKKYPANTGEVLEFGEKELVFVVEDCFSGNNRAWMPFFDLSKLRQILETWNVHLVLFGKEHEGESVVANFRKILGFVKKDPFLSSHICYIPSDSEELASALAAGANAVLDLPSAEFGACGTAWMKGVANLDLLVSMRGGTVADYQTKREEIESLYSKMNEAAAAWSNDFDLEYWVKTGLKNFLPVASGARMLKEYLEYLF